MTPDLALRWTRWRMLAVKLRSVLPMLRSGRALSPYDAETIELGVSALIREGDALVRDLDAAQPIFIGVDLAAADAAAEPRMLHDNPPLYQPPVPRGWLRDMARPTNIVPFPQRPGGRK